MDWIGNNSVESINAKTFKVYSEMPFKVSNELNQQSFHHYKDSENSYEIRIAISECN